jgi:hypothetical protein
MKPTGKWRPHLLNFVTGFVVASAMVLSPGCGLSDYAQDNTGIFFMLEQELETERPHHNDVGWVALDDAGTRWEYHARRRGKVIEVVASCSLAVHKAFGQDKWIGKYYATEMDFDMGTAKTKKSDTLAECVSWVHLHMYGDYFI